MSKSSIYEVVTEEIIQKMERGVIPWNDPVVVKNMSKQVNAITLRPYRGFNALITASQLRSPYWLTMRQAEQIGLILKEGERSTPITFFSFKDRDDRERGCFLKFYRVFNLDQFSNLTPGIQRVLEDVRITEMETDAISSIDRPNNLILSYKDRPKVMRGFNHAFYAPKADTIGMPNQNQFVNHHEYYSTLFHELIHSTGHESRLNRKELNALNYNKHNYSKEELVAEFGSAFLCSMAGISPKVIENQASYIKHWLDKLKSDKQCLYQSIQRAQKAVDYIVGTKFDT